MSGSNLARTLRHDEETTVPIIEYEHQHCSLSALLDLAHDSPTGVKPQALTSPPAMPLSLTPLQPPSLGPQLGAQLAAQLASQIGEQLGGQPLVPEHHFQAWPDWSPPPALPAAAATGRCFVQEDCPLFAQGAVPLPPRFRHLHATNTEVPKAPLTTVLDHYLDSLQALEESPGVKGVAEAAVEATGQRVRQRVVASEVVRVHDEASDSFFDRRKRKTSKERLEMIEVAVIAGASPEKPQNGPAADEGAAKGGPRCVVATVRGASPVAAYPVQGVVSETLYDGQLITSITAPTKMAEGRTSPDKNIVAMPVLSTSVSTSVDTTVLGEAMQAERKNLYFDQEEVDVAIARAAALRLAIEHPECASGPEGSPDVVKTPCVIQ